MAHEIDMSTGKAATAWVGKEPWHGLGTEMTGNETLDQWLVAAGMDWTARRFRVGLDTANDITESDSQQLVNPEFCEIPNMHALRRSDTGAFLGMVSPRYRIVQPSSVMGFFEDLTSSYGFRMETAGCLRGGQVIWALASTDMAVKLEDIDEVRAYLLLATSFDRSVATMARFTSIRVVCNNTLTMAVNGSAGSTVIIPHSRKFDPDQAKIDLKVGKAWEDFKLRCGQFVDRRVDEEEQARFFLNVYHGWTKGDKLEEKHERTIEHMARILRSSPGSDMPTAVGTLWGVLNAVTHDIDYDIGRKSSDRRMNEAWFGGGERIKNRALNLAVDMVSA